MTAKKPIDWEAIERDFRLGQLSLRALAEKHGCTAAAISKKSKEKGWVRDATAEVRERTRAALLTAPRKEEAKVNGVNSTVNTPTQEDIEVAVQTNLQVISRHRRDIAKGHGLVHLLFKQLESAAQDREELENLIEEDTKEDDNAMRRNKLMKAISLPVHAAVLRDLSTSLKNFIPLERQAFNLDEQEHEEPYEERLRRLAGDS